MAYNSAHTGPEIDAAVQLLGQIQDARDSTSQDLIEVKGLSSQVKADAIQVSSDAQAVAEKAAQVASSSAAVEQARVQVVSATEAAEEAMGEAALSANSAQESQAAASVSEHAAAQSQLAAGLSEQVSAEHAAEATQAANQVAADRVAAQASAESAATSARNAEAVVTGGTASVTPNPGLIPLADSAGKIDADWLPESIARAGEVQAAADAAAEAVDTAAEAQSRTERFLLPSPEAPVVRDDGSPLQVGDRYFNAVDQVELIYTNDGWQANDSLQAIAELRGEISEDPIAQGIPRADSSGKIHPDWLPDAYKSQAALTLEQCGVSSSNTPEKNAEKLKEAILSGIPIAGARKAYSFKFEREIISYTGSVLQLDLGPHLHKFIDWGGIVANSLAVLEYNGRIDAEGGYCKGLGRFRRLLRAKVGTLEFQNVFCINPSVDAQFFGIEYSSDSFGDNPLIFDIERVCILNVRTQTYSQASGYAIPMTIIGNYGSSSTQEKQHVVRIGSFRIEEFYSVQQDGITPIDGDSDICRMFTNPTQLTIGAIYARNVAKRFIKTQESVQAYCNNVDWVNDSRFPAGVFVGFFEGQVANSGVPSHFEIGVCRAVYPNADASLPLLFNASGLDHSIKIGTLIYKNIGFYSADRDVGVSIEFANGECLAINAPQCRRLSIKNIKDLGFRSINVAKGSVSDFDLTYGASITTSGFILAGVGLVRGRLRGWRTSSRVAQFYSIEDVTLDYVSGSTYTRAFVPISGGIRSVERLSVNDATLLATQIFEAPSNGSGVLILRNFRAIGGASIAAGFFSSGSWEVKLDDCVPSSFTGSGATVKSVVYA